MTRTSHRWQSKPGRFDALHAMELFPSDNAPGIPCLAHVPVERAPRWLAPYRTRIRANQPPDDGAVHFFMDDYRFETVWSRPRKALEALAPYSTVLSPDFSLYRDWPLMLQMWNVYRNRWCWAFWQRSAAPKRFTVIPTVSWSTVESYDFCSWACRGGAWWRCRRWACGWRMRWSAICFVHVARARVLPPQERRCSARNNAGQQCANWAVWGSTAQVGAPLCPAHLPHGDPRRVSSRLPEEDERRCRATTLDGERCPHWAMLSAESDGLCWIHAFPHHHPQIKHGYYRRVPHFSAAEHALIRRLARQGPPLSAELLVIRLKLRDVLIYLGRSDLAHGDKDRAAYAIFGGAMAVANILLTQQKLRHINWGPRAAGSAAQLLDQILRHTPHPSPVDEPLSPAEPQNDV